MSKINIESFYRATILQPILSTDVASDASPLVIKVSKTPSLSSGLLTISPNTDNEEIVYYSAKNDTNLTISITKRAISSTASALSVDGTDWNVTARKKSHSNLDAIRGDISNLHINQALTSEGGVITGELTFGGTSAIGLNLKQLTTAQRDALTGVNGSLIYNTTTGTVQKYEGGVWTDVASGSTPFATETVAGKVELATLAEVNAGTDTGDSGATNVVIPSVFQSAITTKFATEAEALDATSSSKIMSPLTSKQQFDSRYANNIASNAEALAGTNATKLMSPLETKNVLDFSRPIASNTEAQSGTAGKLVTASQLQSYSGWNIGAGTTNTLVSSAGEKQSTSSSTPQKLKEFSVTVSKPGVIRVTFTHIPYSVNTNNMNSYTQVYKNGAGVGLASVRMGFEGNVTVTRDVSVNAGDVLAIYGWGSVSGYYSGYCGVSNLVASYDFVQNYPTISGTVTLN